MLPSELLRVRISRGRIQPSYVTLDEETLALAERLTRVYSAAVGSKKGELREKLRNVEDEYNDYKLVRGISILLERRCVFEIASELDPVKARGEVFKEASRVKVSSALAREAVLRKVSTVLGVSVQALESALFSDTEDELILRSFRQFPSASVLLKYYNLSVTQTLLFKTLRFEFTASENWKKIFRDVKRLGLIYSIEKEGPGAAGFRVSLDGPLSLFKMTDRYGTAIAKLLPQIAGSEGWMIRAEILSRSRRVYDFVADSGELKDLIVTGAQLDRLDEEVIVGAHGPQRSMKPSSASNESIFDSATERRFARSFASYGTDWTLRREPEPLVAGTHVMIPDFSFEKSGMKTYLEIVGFWTPQYIERKMAKLDSVVGEVDMIVAVDETLACSKLERLEGRARVVYFRKDVPLKPIIDHLKEREASAVREQVQKLGADAGKRIVLTKDVVSLGEIAGSMGIEVPSLRAALRDFEPDGYVRVGDSYFVSRSKLDCIEEKLSSVETLTSALEIIEASGVRDEPGRVLEALGYSTVWEGGLEMDKVKIAKTKSKEGSKHVMR